MKISHNYPLHQDSIQYIKEVYSRYKKVKWDSDKIIKNPLIHMKATADTRDKNGNLLGYHDCMLFTLTVFDTVNMTRMKIQNRDGLDTWHENDVNLKKLCIMKDGSTFVDLKGEYKFSNTQAVSIHPTFDGLTKEELKRHKNEELSWMF